MHLLSLLLLVACTKIVKSLHNSCTNHTRYDVFKYMFVVFMFRAGKVCNYFSHQLPKIFKLLKFPSWVIPIKVMWMFPCMVSNKNNNWQGNLPFPFQITCNMYDLECGHDNFDSFWHNVAVSYMMQGASLVQATLGWSGQYLLTKPNFMY